jgi:hypothetical protein
MDIPQFLEAIAIVLTGLASAMLADVVTAACKPRVRASLQPTRRRVKVFVALLIVVNCLLLASAWSHSFRYPVLLLSSVAVFAAGIYLARRRGLRDQRRLLEFGVDADTLIRFQGRRYRVGVHGVRAMQLVIEMANAAEREPANPLVLLPYRRRVREVMHAPPRAVLAYSAERTDDPVRRRLAVWLRGRCRGTLGTLAFGRLWAGADLPLRKELTRAFNRMDAWDYLRRIEENDPVPRIRQMARQTASRPFDSRLARFVACVARSESPGREAPLFLHEEFDLAAGRPAKPPWLIRRILEHIRLLVRAPADTCALQSD